MLEALSKKQLKNTLAYTEDIITNLSDSAMSELLEGYDLDIQKLFIEILLQT